MNLQCSGFDFIVINTSHIADLCNGILEGLLRIAIQILKCIAENAQIELITRTGSRMDYNFIYIFILRFWSFFFLNIWILHLLFRLFRNNLLHRKRRSVFTFNVERPSVAILEFAAGNYLCSAEGIFALGIVIIGHRDHMIGIDRSNSTSVVFSKI